MSSLNILFWLYWVSLFSYLLILWAFACTFCFNVSVNCATSLTFVTLYFLKIFLFFLLSFTLSEPVPVSAITDNSFLQLFICFCILIFQNLTPLLFLLLLLGSFYVCVIIVTAACIRLFISVIFNSSSSKSSSITPFISSWSFINLLFVFNLGSLSLSDICRSLTVCHIIWRSSFSLFLTVCCSPLALGCLLICALSQSVFSFFFVSLLVFYTIYISSVAIHFVCVIFCGFSYFKSNIFSYLVNFNSRYYYYYHHHHHYYGFMFNKNIIYAHVSTCCICPK